MTLQIASESASHFYDTEFAFLPFRQALDLYVVMDDKKCIMLYGIEDFPILILGWPVFM